MSEEHADIIVYGTTWCPDCRRAKHFLGEHRIHYHWIDIEQDDQAMERVRELNQGRRMIPTILFPDNSIMVEPSNAELAKRLGLSTRAESTFYDVIIIGGGPAGLSAAIYTSREGLDTLVIEKDILGGQAGVTQTIENYPGFVEGISGQEFGERLAQQARRFGGEILLTQAVSGLRVNGRYREVLTTDGHCYAARAVLIATGARYRRLEVPGEEELIGVNVHFCATCDGAFYKGKELLVLGGGNSAFEESLFLTRFARRITIATHGPDIKASRVLQEKVAEQEAISVYTNHDVQAFLVEKGQLAGVRIKDLDTGEIKEWHPDGVFVFIGVTPNSGFLPPEIQRDGAGFVLTDRAMQTSIEGVFAAGDVREGATPQAASAVGEGAAAAIMIREYLQSVG
ncbi:MAG: FAD-dependent oxidoreductase [Anaerolineae bacterium]|nr:FAD-dependent oxidoreductase [Anaerolineae bacterium]